MLLALDPGQNSPGIALFQCVTAYPEPVRTLVFADRVRVPDYTSSPPGARWFLVAQQIVDALLRRGEDDLVDTIVFECPQWDARSKKVDPNDLVGIAGVAANVCGMLHRNNPRVLSPTPAEWIGQLSKKCAYCKSLRAMRKGTGVRTRAKFCTACHGSAWETPRGRFIKKRLEPAELALVPDQNDAIDAVGLGLWALGRLKPHTVFSNGRDGR
jgi:hypothetical protein